MKCINSSSYVHSRVPKCDAKNYYVIVGVWNVSLLNDCMEQVLIVY